LHRLGLERSTPQALQLAGRAGKDDDDRPAHLEHEPRRSAGEPERICPLGNRRLLPDAGLELLVGTAESFRQAPDDPADLLLELGVDAERPAGHPRQHLHGPVVVSRPETAGRDEQVGVQSFAERVLQFLRVVAHDDDSRGLDAAGGELSREERAVVVDPAAADELAARDEDDRCRVAQPGVETGVTRFAVMSTDVGLPRSGTLTTRPLTLKRRFAGRPIKT
jgi:hypothetical protein